MKHFIKDFNVSQTELIQRFAEHHINIRKGRMSMIFNKAAQFTDWQKAVLNTIEKEVVRDRKKQFATYKSNVVLTNKLKKNEK